jgi:hypothetical protein
MRYKTGRISIFLSVAFLVFGVDGCKKLVDIPPPTNTVTTSQVFSNDLEATSAMTGVYSGMINSAPGTAFNGGMTIYPGASADEFHFVTLQVAYSQFQNDDLLNTNYIVNPNFWQPIYSTIYGCNAVIAGVESSSGVDDSTRSELTGEAELVRAFSYFYLVNLFGEVPLVTTTNYNKTSLLSKSPVDTIYSAIIADLKDAQSRLASDYSVGQGQRIVPNKWAATALLARVYLFNNDFTDAVTQSTAVINNTNLYSLVSNLQGVFLINSTEAIWQLQQSNQTNTYNATPEGFLLITINSTSEPQLVSITPSLLNAFEDSDNRRQLWIDSSFYSGQYYYYPFKYEIGDSAMTANGPYTEYYMVLRLAEQYLIRADAEAEQNQLTSAAGDLNVIRNRAGLANIPDSISSSQTSLLAAILRERRVELFAEWGHRWLDLRREEVAKQVLSADKGITVTSNALLYPIPFAEIQTDPNLVQNPGY